MAMRACSLNSTSTSIFSVPRLHHTALPSQLSALKIPNYATPSITSHSPRLVPEIFLTTAAMAEAIALANAAAQAAKQAVSSSAALDDIISMQSSYDQEHNSAAPRKRRRKKRKRNRDAIVVESSGYLMEGYSSRSERSRYLTRAQEGEFSRCIKEGAMVESTVAESASDGRMKRRSDEKMLMRARECRERITLSYKRLVVAIATPYQGKGLSLQDLIQEGCIGLLRGAQRFDSKRGNKLSTYVYWWIKQAIIRAIAKKSRLVRLPGSLCEVAVKVAEAHSLLTRQLGRWPTYEEIADHTGISVFNVKLVSERIKHPISINQPMKHKKMTLEDIIPGPDETRPETHVKRQLMLQDMEKLLKKLSAREEYVIRSYYGLNGERARSCDEIGRSLNLSRERIRQIHCNALTILRGENDLLENLKENVI